MDDLVTGGVVDMRACQSVIQSMLPRHETLKSHDRKRGRINPLCKGTRHSMRGDLDAFSEASSMRSNQSTVGITPARHQSQKMFATSRVNTTSWTPKMIDENSRRTTRSVILPNIYTATTVGRYPSIITFKTFPIAQSLLVGKMIDECPSLRSRSRRSSHTHSPHVWRLADLPLRLDGPSCRIRHDLWKLRIRVLCIRDSQRQQITT